MRPDKIWTGQKGKYLQSDNHLPQRKTVLPAHPDALTSPAVIKLTIGGFFCYVNTSMFEKLQERLETTFKKLRGYGKLSETNVKDSLREVRIALLEADVNYKVAKDFLDKVKEKVLGAEVLTSITPGQQFIKIVFDELCDLLGIPTSPLT